MPIRTTPLVDNEFYHLYNRGVEKRNIFMQFRDYFRFQQTFFYYQFQGPKPSFSKFSKQQLTLFKPLNQNKVVEIICFCLMPNHFHFLVRQLKGNGISLFMGQAINSYTKYFNTKYNRVGPLMQGPFKAVRAESDEQLIHLSRYIHLNPIVSGIIKELDSYKYSSYSEYISGISTICNTSEILNFFSSPEDYKKFTEAQIDYGTTLEILKHRAIDIDE